MNERRRERMNGKDERETKMKGNTCREKEEEGGSTRAGSRQQVPRGPPRLSQFFTASYFCRQTKGRSGKPSG